MKSEIEQNPAEPFSEFIRNRTRGDPVTKTRLADTYYSNGGSRNTERRIAWFESDSRVHRRSELEHLPGEQKIAGSWGGLSQARKIGEFPILHSRVAQRRTLFSVMHLVSADS